MLSRHSIHAFLFRYRCMCITDATVSNYIALRNSGIVISIMIDIIMIVVADAGTRYHAVAVC